MRHAAIAIIALSITCTDAHAIRYHVMASAAGTGTGLSWTNAYTDLQEALSVVIPGDEIWVAAGQYKPTTGTARTVSFVLRNGVDLYGGFAGTENTLEERDIASNPTTLNGDIGQVGDPLDNSYSVVTGNNITSNIVMDGFRIMNGRGASGNHGGGLRLTNALGGSVLLRRCSFINNYSATYGGGIYLAASNLIIENCDFIGNQTNSGGDGGAILNGNNNGGYSSLEIHGSRFIGNVARRGAGIYNTVRYENVLIDRCIFTNNTSDFNILVLDYFTSARILNSYLIGNSINDGSGEVLYVISSASGEPLELINCTIADNFNLDQVAVQSEAVRLQRNYYQVHNCIIHGNTAYQGRQINELAVVSHSLIEGGYTGGTDIIDLEPEFNAPYQGVPANFDASIHDYTLGTSSPAVNVGDNTHVLPGFELDLANAPRIQAGTVDLGCYESSFTVGHSDPPTTTTGWIYNMVDGSIHVLDTQDLKGSITILDLGGREVLRRALNERIVRLDLPTGQYLAVAEGRDVLRFIVP